MSGFSSTWYKPVSNKCALMIHFSKDENGGISYDLSFVERIMVLWKCYTVVWRDISDDRV